MRHFKIALMGVCVVALSLGAAYAGVNPADPGLAVRNNSSNICIDCHTVAPGGGATHYGSHFVYDPTVTGTLTNSGGGGNWNYDNAARDAGQYFKTTQWAESTGYSKYGNTADNTSVGAGNDNAAYGSAVYLAASNSAYAGHEIICESCHNVVKNVAGGNNLLAPMTALTSAPSVQVSPVQEANEATICVGCHGFMYGAGTGYTATASPGTYYADARNTADVSPGGRKGNNGVHYINGAKYRQNHHVMTGDKILNADAALGLLWRDVLTVPSDGEETGVIDTASTRGQMPQRATWNNTDTAGKVKATTTTYLNCIQCHSAPHSGLAGTAASILRDQDAGGNATLSTDRHTYIARIGENNRTWMGFNDYNYCQDCHTLATK